MRELSTAADEQAALLLESGVAATSQAGSPRLEVTEAGNTDRMSESADTADHSSMPAANQAKTEPMPTVEHESALSSEKVSSDDPQAPTKQPPDSSKVRQPKDHPLRR